MLETVVSQHLGPAEGPAAVQHGQWERIHTETSIPKGHEVRANQWSIGGFCCVVKDCDQEGTEKYSRIRSSMLSIATKVHDCICSG